MKELKELTEAALKVLSFLAAASLVAGFLIWNIYLVRLGFYEFDFLEARYIHTGIFFLIPTLFALSLLHVLLFWIRSLILRLKRKIRNEPSALHMLFREHLRTAALSIAYCYVCGLFVAASLYAFLLFPRLSQTYGGAQPRVLSIIASEQEISYLANFKIVKSAPIETENLCVAYENSEVLIILRRDRILSIKKSDIGGFVSLPAKTRDQLSAQCADLARDWLFNQGEWGDLECIDSSVARIG